jgi:hypothetical protein
VPATPLPPSTQPQRPCPVPTQALADFYTVQPSLGGTLGAPDSPPTQQAAQQATEQQQPGEGPSCAASKDAGGGRSRAWLAEHILLPALRRHLAPAKKRASDGSVVELTRLEALYRVFERC